MHIHRRTHTHRHPLAHKVSDPPPTTTHHTCTFTGPYTYRTYYHKADVAFLNDGHSVEFAVNQKQVYQPDKSQSGAYL